MLRPLLLAVLLAMTGLGQRSRFQEPEEEGPRPVFPSLAEFHFIRVEYTDLPEYHRYFGFASRGARAEGWWVVDWPDADDHFSQGVERLTRVRRVIRGTCDSPTTGCSIIRGCTQRKQAGGI
jgi:hypothetical protein